MSSANPEVVRSAPYFYVLSLLFNLDPVSIFQWKISATPKCLKSFFFSKMDEFVSVYYTYSQEKKSLRLQKNKDRSTQPHNILFMKSLKK